MVRRSCTDAKHPEHNGRRVGESLLATGASQNQSRLSGSLACMNIGISWGLAGRSLPLRSRSDFGRTRYNSHALAGLPNTNPSVCSLLHSCLLKGLIFAMIRILPSTHSGLSRCFAENGQLSWSRVPPRTGLFS